MLSIDRTHVQLEPVAGPQPSAVPAGSGRAPSAPAAPMDAEDFRARVLAVLEEALREMDRRGSR